jgi:ketosteroid isomerase-like protein
VQNDSRMTLRFLVPKIKELRKSGHSASQRKPWGAAALGLLAEPKMRWLPIAMILGSSMLVSWRCVAAVVQQAQAAAPARVARTSKAAGSLLNADRALAAESHVIGFVAAYAKAMAPDARKLDGGEQPVIGRASILALMARYPAGLSIDWTPEEAVVAESGELGFTWGRYVASVHDSNGKLVVQYGKYLDVWQRQSDGAWRWIADIGNGNPPPP